jgi:hypothetical protein
MGVAVLMRDSRVWGELDSAGLLGWLARVDIWKVVADFTGTGVGFPDGRSTDGHWPILTGQECSRRQIAHHPKTHTEVAVGGLAEHATR